MSVWRVREESRGIRVRTERCLRKLRFRGERNSKAISWKRFRAVWRCVALHDAGNVLRNFDAAIRASLYQ